MTLENLIKELNELLKEHSLPIDKEIIVKDKEYAFSRGIESIIYDTEWQRYYIVSK